MFITGNEKIHFCFTGEEGEDFLSGILEDQTAEPEEVINVNDFGLIDDLGKRLPRNFTRTQKTSKDIRTTEDNRKDFSSLVRWTDRNHSLYPSLPSNFIG